MNLSIPALLLGATLLASATPARAEFPFAIRAKGGLGPGFAHSNDGVLGDGEVFGFAGADIVWRFAPGRSVLAAFEGTGKMESHVVPADASHLAATLAFEVSQTRGSRVATYLQGGLGAGRVTTSPAPSPAWSPERPAPFSADRENTEWGTAMSGEVGLRILHPRDPVGFLVGVHGSGVVAPHSRNVVVAVFLGLTLQPL